MCESQPLQKTTNNKAKEQPISYSKDTSPRDQEIQSSVPNEAQTSGTLDGTIMDDSIQLPEPPRPYFSFTSFILQNSKPQIFEWLFLQDLGKGSMSQIYLVKNTESDNLCVAKVYNNAVLHRQTLGNEDPPIDCLNREIKIMSSISHPNVLSFHEMIDDNPTNSTILILPYASYGNLRSIVEENRISFDNLLVCAYQIADGLKFMHSKNIAHRDVKPENILAFNETYYWISSFTVSTVMESADEEHTDMRGTPSFWSPEECTGKPFNPKNCDIWAFGMTFYWAVFKKLPFGIVESKSKPLNAFSMHEIFEKAELEFPQDRKDVPPAFVKLLESILQKDPSKRLTFEEIQSNEIFDRAREIQKLEISTMTPKNETDSIYNETESAITTGSIRSVSVVPAGK